MKQSELKKADRVLVPRCRLATGFFTRFLGLMGKSGIARDEAILFPRCNSIHTFFMRFPIDIVFVSQEGEVVEVIEAMRPWRLCLPRKRVAHTIEMQAKLASALGIHPGDRLSCQGAWA